MIRYGFLLLLLISAQAYAQQEYVGKPFDSVYVILAKKYQVDESRPDNPSSSQIIKRCPFYDYELCGVTGSLMTYFGDDRIIDSVTWWGTYVFDGCGLAEKGTYEYQYIDSIKSSYVRRFGKIDDEESSDECIVFSWELDNDIDLFLRIDCNYLYTVFDKEE